MMREGLRSLLEEKLGYECVAEASDGYEAVKKAREFHPDIVVMDIVLPNLNGIDATRQIKSQQPEIEVVLSEARAGRPPADGEALEALVTKGSLMGAIFRTADLDTVFEKVRASGAEVMQEPTDQPWGVRDCAFRDPSGNMVRINQA